MSTNLSEDVRLIASKLNCGDFLAFQEQLIRSRKIDDNIVHMLNTTIPSESFIARPNTTPPKQQCKNLWNQLVDTYGQREATIKHCIHQMSERVRLLKQQRETEDSHETNKQLKKEQRILRLLQSELNVEEVVSWVMLALNFGITFTMMTNYFDGL